MDKLFSIGTLVFAGIGGFFTWLFGGFDTMLTALVVLVALDFLTGLIKGISTKTLSSDICFRGVFNKILIFIIVAVSVVIQSLIGTSIPIREVVILFYVANEGISLLENSAEFIPFPPKLKDILLQLRDKANSEEGTDNE